MVSIAWVMWAFLLGGFAGVLMLAVASMAAREDERAVRAEGAVRHGRSGSVDLDSQWKAVAK